MKGTKIKKPKIRIPLPKKVSRPITPKTVYKRHPKHKGQTAE